MQFGVVSLWSLLEACRAGSDEEQVEAARGAAAAVRAHAGDEGLTIELRGSLLVVDDFPAVSGVDTFAATHGLLAFLRDADVERVRFDADVGDEALLGWARQVVAGRGPIEARRGVAVRRRGRTDDSGVVRPHLQTPQGLDQSDSRLRSVFLQHRLIAGLPGIDGVDAGTAKLVIQGVVDRLLQVEGGLEPLMLLQQDEALLRRSTAVAVLAVVFARSAGWPPEQLADLGTAGLLHDLGSMLDQRDPDTAAFRWLLDRGDDDFWLRSALCARRWRDGEGASEDAAGPLAVVAIVRLAAAVHRGGRAAIDEIVAGGGAPDELGQLARSALAG